MKFFSGWILINFAVFEWSIRPNFNVKIAKTYSQITRFLTDIGLFKRRIMP